jgi:hypothetical protein
VADELDDFITQLTTVLGAMTGIESAPPHPPEAINDPPMVVCYFVGGEFRYGGDLAIGVHTVHADVHLSRSDLAHDEEYARPFILRGLVAVAGNVTMSSTCEHCLLQSYEYGGLGYGGQETFGVRYVLEVKIKHAGVTIAA